MRAKISHTHRTRTLIAVLAVLLAALLPATARAQEDSAEPLVIDPVIQEEPIEVLEVTEPEPPISEDAPVLLDVQADATPNMTIHAINLGNDYKGDAVIVESDSDLLLMDLGSPGAYDVVAAALDEHGAPKINAPTNKTLSLYISHYHSDHVGGLGEGDTLQQILNTYQVSTVYLPAESIFKGRIDGSLYLERGNRIARIATNLQPNCTVQWLKVGSAFFVGDISAEVIGPVGVNRFTDPGKEPANDSEDEDGPWDKFANNCSLVTRMACGNVSFLTTGDSDDESTNALARTYGDDLKSDILKLSHHGFSGNTEKFLALVSPTYSFVTNNHYTQLRSYNNSDYHVRKTYTARQRAEEYGLCYALGDEDDGLVIRSDGNSKLCYRHSDQQTPLANGIVKVAGSYGEDHGGGAYDLYDYFNLDENGSPIGGICDVTIEGVKGARLFNAGGRLVLGKWTASGEASSFIGWNEYNDGKQYIYQDTATLASGFATIAGVHYYFPPSNDYCRATGDQKIGEYYYLFNDNGKMLSSCWNGERYYYADGKRASGISTINGKIYYLDPTTGKRAYGLQKVDGNYYCFREESGTAYANMTKKLDGYKCTFDKNGVWTNVPKPVTPKLNKIKTAGKKALTLSWNQQDADGYRLYMSTSKSGPYTKVKTITNAATTTYTKKSLKSKKTYYFKIRSYKKVLGKTFYSKTSKVASQKTT